MKRDLNLVRSILLFTESRNCSYSDKDIEIDDYSFQEINYHLAIMIEENLLFGHTTVLHNDNTTTKVIRMTWKGHDFLDASRDSQRWKQAKEIFETVGGVTFDVAKDVLIQLMTKNISHILAGIA